MTPEQEIQAFQVLFDYLTNAAVTDPYLMDHKFPVKLTPQQAAELIYILEEKLDFGQNDVRMELCPICETMTENEHSEACETCDRVFCNEHNRVNFCEDCGDFACKDCDPDFCDDCEKCSLHCSCEKIIEEKD